MRRLDAELPAPPDDRELVEDDGRDHSEERGLRLKLHLLQKRGRGGYR